MLKDRGYCIMNQDFDKMRKLEQSITELKDEHYDSLTRPVCAFITFEEEEGYQTASRIKAHKVKLLGENIDIRPATEPTNIIWENRHITKLQMFERSLVATAIILVLLLCSFVIIFEFKRSSIKAN